MSGLSTMYAESSAARAEWKAKFEEAIRLRKVVQESNKVFEIETISTDTFLVPSHTGGSTPSWSHESLSTGRVTCSVPFCMSYPSTHPSSTDWLLLVATAGRKLVAIGCAEGIWIGFPDDPKCKLLHTYTSSAVLMNRSIAMRRVLHLKTVTQCAILENIGIFLVLADKSLFAYHIEALVPSSPQSAYISQTPQKLNGNVHFFSVGSLGGRTLVIYMTKKGVRPQAQPFLPLCWLYILQLDNIFRMLEPIAGKIKEKTQAPVSLSSRLGIRSTKSEWFGVYRVSVPIGAIASFILTPHIGILTIIRILWFGFLGGWDRYPNKERLSDHGFDRVSGQMITNHFSWIYWI